MLGKTTSQGTQTTATNSRCQGMDSPLGTPGRTRLCHHLELIPLKLTSGSRSPKLRKNTVYTALSQKGCGHLLQQPQEADSVLICHSTYYNTLNASQAGCFSDLQNQNGVSALIKAFKTSLGANTINSATSKTVPLSSGNETGSSPNLPPKKSPNLNLNSLHPPPSDSVSRFETQCPFHRLFLAQHMNAFFAGKASVILQRQTRI